MDEQDACECVKCASGWGTFFNADEIAVLRAQMAEGHALAAAERAKRGTKVHPRILAARKGLYDNLGRN
jgi:hypothetical protein